MLFTALALSETILCWRTSTHGHDKGSHIPDDLALSGPLLHVVVEASIEMANIEMADICNSKITNSGCE